MNILYLVKHFPCLSQTFVLNEVVTLTARGCRVFVVSALAGECPVEDSEIAARVAYLEYDYLYRYGARAEARDGTALEQKVRDARAPGGSRVPAAVRERLWQMLSESEPDPEIRHRGFLDALRVAAIVHDERISHLHGDFAEDNVRLAYIVHRATGVPFTFKMRAYDIFAEPQADVARWAAAAESVLTISEYNRSYICRRWGIAPGKVRVIYDGIRVEQVPPVRRYTHRPFRIVSAARLVEKKGFPILLEACRALNDHLPMTCEIFGDGPLRAELQHQIDRLGLASIVTLRGARPHAEVLAALEDASVFVLPCVVAANGDRDGTPNSLLEAMARGVPIVSTTLSGIPEIIEDGADGLLVPPNDAQALADAIARIAGDHLLAERLARHARATVLERHRIDRTVDEFLRLLPSEHAA